MSLKHPQRADNPIVAKNLLLLLLFLFRARVHPRKYWARLNNKLRR